MDSSSIQSLSLMDLSGMPLETGFKRALELFKKVQDSMYALANTDNADLTSQKIGVMLVFAVLNKLSEGKDPRQFAAEDWAEIAETVSDFAVLDEGEQYTTFIFSRYADYIDWSAHLFEERLPKDKIEAITGLSDELRNKTAELHNNSISETQYIEDNLWICLEAMIKLLSSLVYYPGMTEIADAAQAAAMLTFECVRLKLYSNEQALLNEYIQNQLQLDEELNARFEAYKEQLVKETEAYETLIKGAFAPDFRESLRSSAELARAAGVNEEEILKSVSDIDDFFM